VTWRETTPARHSNRYCKRGHDTYEVGRVNNGQCRTCHNTAQANRREQKRNARGLLKPSSAAAWERARVAMWLEIVAEDPIDELATTHARMRAFEARYARLEATVPKVDA